MTLQLLLIVSLPKGFGFTRKEPPLAGTQQSSVWHRMAPTLNSKQFAVKETHWSKKKNFKKIAVFILKERFNYQDYKK